MRVKSLRDLYAAAIYTQTYRNICDVWSRAILNYRCKQEQLSLQVDRLKDAGSRMVKSFWWWGDDDDEFFEDAGEEVSSGATGSYTPANYVCSCIL